MDAKKIYKLILEKFYDPSLQNYIDVIDLCTNNINKNYNDVNAHYVKSMALFGIATLINKADEIYAYNHNKEVKHSSNGELMRKIEDNFKLADNAVEEFNIAYSIDNKIIEKHPYLKVIVNYKLTGVRYLFSRPIPSKDIMDLIFQNKKWGFISVIGILFFCATILALILVGELFGVKILLIGMSFVIMLIFIYPNENKKIINKYKEYILKQQ